MLQRIQTIYLVIATLLSGVLAFIVPFWNDINGESFMLIDLMNDQLPYYKALPFLFMLSGILSLIAIFLYKNRIRQINSNRLNIVINFLLLGIIVYHLLSLPGGMDISKKGIGVFIPLLVIVFLALANKAILKDENLVKSVDRLR